MARLNNCRFNPTAGALTDWTYSSVVAGYNDPVTAGAVTATSYEYFAISTNLADFEGGKGVCTITGGVPTFARTTILFNSLGTTAKINFAAAPQVAIVVLKDDLLSVDEANGYTSAQQDQGRANLGVPGRNKIKDGGFTINQRGYVSAAALSAGTYAHDRWKGGASGGDYSFTQLASPTTITIAASKSLIQVVEDKDVEGGSYTLSWSGTATARVTINSATPSGNFAVSPITVAGQTAGTTMSVEFTGANASGGSSIATNSGTVGAVQLEAGTKATAFEFRAYSAELTLCQRYCQLFQPFNGAVFASNQAIMAGPFPVPMRIAPTSVAQNTTTTLEDIISGAFSQSAPSVSGFCVTPYGAAYNLGNFSGMTTGHPLVWDNVSSYLILTAEL